MAVSKVKLRMLYIMKILSENQMKDIHFQRLISIDCFRTMVWQRIVRQSIVILRH